MYIRESLVGKTINRIYVIEQVNRPEGEKYKKSSKTDWYKCRCICKEDNPTFIISGHSLRKGYVKSCGCLRREIAAEQIKRNREKMIESGNTTRPHSKTNMIPFRNETKCLSEWAKDIGISKSALSNRIQSGWTMEEALTTKKGEKRHATKK
jgi:hypothetical protein